MERKVFMRKIIALLLPALRRLMLPAAPPPPASDLIRSGQGTLIAGSRYAPMDYKQRRMDGSTPNFPTLCKELDV